MLFSRRSIHPPNSVMASTPWFFSERQNYCACCVPMRFRNCSDSTETLGWVDRRRTPDSLTAHELLNWDDGSERTRDAAIDALSVRSTRTKGDANGSSVTLACPASITAIPIGDFLGRPSPSSRLKGLRLTAL